MMSWMTDVRRRYLVLVGGVVVVTAAWVAWGPWAGDIRRHVWSTSVNGDTPVATRPARPARPADEPIPILKTVTPTRFVVHFCRLNVAFLPDGSIIQVTDGDSVISYGADWRVLQQGDLVYHVKRSGWEDVFLRVEARDGGRVEKVTGATAPAIPASVSIVGGTIKVSFRPGAVPQMIVDPAQKTIRFEAAGLPLADERLWEMVFVDTHLVHLRKRRWRNFFWKVDTSRQELYYMTGIDGMDFGTRDQYFTWTYDWPVIVQHDEGSP